MDPKPPGSNVRDPRWRRCPPRPRYTRSSLSMRSEQGSTNQQQPALALLIIPQHQTRCHAQPKMHAVHVFCTGARILSFLSDLVGGGGDLYGSVGPFHRQVEMTTAAKTCRIRLQYASFMLGGAFPCAINAQKRSTLGRKHVASETPRVFFMAFLKSRFKTWCRRHVRSGAAPANSQCCSL